MRTPSRLWSFTMIREGHTTFVSSFFSLSNLDGLTFRDMEGEDEDKDSDIS